MAPKTDTSATRFVQISLQPPKQPVCFRCAPRCTTAAHAHSRPSEYRMLGVHGLSRRLWIRQNVHRQQRAKSAPILLRIVRVARSSRDIPPTSSSSREMHWPCLLQSGPLNYQQFTQGRSPKGNKDVPKRTFDDPREHGGGETERTPEGSVSKMPSGILEKEFRSKVGNGQAHIIRRQMF